MMQCRWVVWKFSVLLLVTLVLPFQSPLAGVHQATGGSHSVRFPVGDRTPVSGQGMTLAQAGDGATPEALKGDSAVTLPAADYFLLPRLSVREAYDDNVFFDDEEDLEQLVTPSLEMGGRTERLVVSASARLDIYNYLDLTEYNRVNQFYNFSGAYALNRRTDTGVDASFLRDYSFETELLESGLVLDRSRRERFFVRPSLSHQLDERSRLELDYRYQDTRYDRESDTDNVLHGAGATYSRLMDNQRTTLLGSLDLQYVEYEPVSGDGEQVTVQALTGFSHAFAPDRDVVVRAGLSYTDSSFDVHGDDVDESDWGYLFDATANWRWERTLISLSASHTITTSSFGENITRDRVLLRMDHRLTERLRAFGNINAYLSTTEGLVNDEEQRTLSINPGISYRLTELIDLRLGYRYRVTEDVEDDDRESSNMVFGQIDFRFPDLLN